MSDYVSRSEPRMTLASCLLRSASHRLRFIKNCKKSIRSHNKSWSLGYLTGFIEINLQQHINHEQIQNFWMNWWNLHFKHHCLHETVTNVFHIMEKWKYQFEMFDWNFVPLNITFAWSLHESNHSTNTEMQKSSEHGEHARAIFFSWAGLIFGLLKQNAYLWVVNLQSCTACAISTAKSIFRLSLSTDCAYVIVLGPH